MLHFHPCHISDRQTRPSKGWGLPCSRWRTTSASPSSSWSNCSKEEPGRLAGTSPKGYQHIWINFNGLVKKIWILDSRINLQTFEFLTLNLASGREHRGGLLAIRRKGCYHIHRILWHRVWCTKDRRKLWGILVKLWLDHLLLLVWIQNMLEGEHLDKVEEQ